MKIQPIETQTNPSFKIYKKTRITDFGQCVYGVFKNQNIEVYSKKEDGKLIHKLFYVSDCVRRFIKSKLIYFENGKKKILRCARNDKSL